MSHFPFPNSAWPTMITPFREDGSIDYTALGKLTDLYITNGAGGLFSTCQSSEIFYLSLEERTKLTRFVVEQAAGRVPVVASGHISYSMEDQKRELSAIADCGVDAVILISNRLAAPDESDSILLDRLDHLIRVLPKEIPLGFYECPYPYKRLLTPPILDYCIKSGRFYFLKDTCCSLPQIEAKLKLLKGSPIHLYNANTATLLGSLRSGASGYSGVMANFQMRLYAWLVKHWQDSPETSQRLQNVLTFCSYIELKNYPQNAKAYLNRYFVPMSERCRKTLQAGLSKDDFTALEQLRELTLRMEAKLGI